MRPSASNDASKPSDAAANASAPRIPTSHNIAAIKAARKRIGKSSDKGHQAVTGRTIPS